MPIVTFWNESRKESGQTTSIIALATHMALEHNYRVLLVDASFDDNSIEKAFFKARKENKTLQELTQGKMDISSGAEGLVSAIASNKVTPEIITNYTRVVFKNRLDVLTGLSTSIHENFEKSMALYKDLLVTANKFYDLVFVDLEKTLRYPFVKSILENTNLIVYCMSPNLANIDNFMKKRTTSPLLIGPKVIPLLARSDESSSYNIRNATRYMKEKTLVPTIPYNVRFMEATNEAKAANFFADTKLSKAKYDLNQNFMQEVERAAMEIIDRIKLLQKQVQLTTPK